MSDETIKKSYKEWGRDFDISFAGGEPFLRNDLSKIVGMVEKLYPGSFKCVTTNGLLKERILAFVRENRHLDFKVNVSLDGLEKINDRLRGRGAFRRAVQTVRALKKYFPRRRWRSSWR